MDDSCVEAEYYYYYYCCCYYYCMLHTLLSGNVPVGYLLVGSGFFGFGANSQTYSIIPNKMVPET